MRPTLGTFSQYSGTDGGVETPNSRPNIVDQSTITRDAKSVEFFWSVQVVSAYESAFETDGDLNGNTGKDISFAQWYDKQSGANVRVGYSYLRDGMGPSVIFTEELRDLSDENPGDLRPEPELTSIVAAHEVMHRFYGWHDPLDPNSFTNLGLMNGRNAMASLEFLNSRGVGFVDISPSPLQFQYLQSRKRPL